MNITNQNPTRLVGVFFGKGIFWCGVLASLALLFPLFAHAQNETQLLHAEVVEVISEQEQYQPGLDVTVLTQLLRAKTEAGVFIEIENDRVPLEVGDMFFVDALTTESGEVLYTVREPDRRNALAWAVALFAGASILVGRFTGLRALVSLGVSFGIIIWLLLPSLASGVSPVVAATGFSALILALAMGITHGVNRTTIAAFLASMVTIVIAIGLGEFFVSFAHLTGFADDTTTILNLSTGGSLNMQGILLGALIIGILGIIDDLAITQVATVAELHDVNGMLSPRELYARAMRIGREHFGAVINTLFLAYAGAALPLLLLIGLSPSSPLILINSEIIAIEIIRAAVGGAALAAALPIATALGVFALRFKEIGNRPHTHHH